MVHGVPPPHTEEVRLCNVEMKINYNYMYQIKL